VIDTIPFEKLNILSLTTFNSMLLLLNSKSNDQTRTVDGNVADPNPDLDSSDPNVCGPPGSRTGSISERHGAGSVSGSFYHLAKIVKKTLIPTVLLLLFDFLLLKNDVNVPSKRKKHKNFFFIYTSFLLAV
jgi:hypothetical protein